MIAPYLMTDFECLCDGAWDESEMRQCRECKAAVCGDECVEIDGETYCSPAISTSCAPGTDPREAERDYRMNLGMDEARDEF